MSAFADHLAEAARRREAAGLTRVLSCDHPHGLIDLAGNDYLALRRHPDVIAAAVAAHVEDRHPTVDVAVHDGGQPRYPLLVSVE